VNGTNDYTITKEGEGKVQIGGWDLNTKVYNATSVKRLLTDYPKY